MANELAAALTNHDRVRRSTDIPLFYGKKGRDTVTPQQLVERIDKAATIAGWNTQKRVCDEFYMCLREGAMSWYNTLENIPNFDMESWDDMKTEFLKAYAPRFTAKTLCTNFQDLRQKQEQSVQDFYNHVSDVFRDAYKVKPNHVLTHPGVNAADQANADAIRLAGIMAMQLLMMNTVFIGGLREEIRKKVLEAGPTKIQESVDLARQIEVIVQEKKAKGAVVSSIEKRTNEDEESEEDDDEMLQIINAVRARKGKAPYKFRPGQGSSGGYRPGNKTGVQCHYCKNMGHYQKDCRKRMNAGAPLVKPPNRAAAIKSPEDEDGAAGNENGWDSLNY
jgi:hypothetical protein